MQTGERARVSNFSTLPDGAAHFSSFAYQGRFLGRSERLVVSFDTEHLGNTQLQALLRF